METIGAVILAAGGSTRLGQPKQLLRHHGETLVRRAARAALEAGCLPAIIVTGQDHEQIAKALSGLGVRLHRHADWQRGIGSSIRAGLAHALFHQPALEALLIMVCDQPFVSAELLAALLSARAEARTEAAACTYAGATGVPALFGRALFPALAALPDGQGAKAILSALAGEIARVEFPAGAIDIDTPADWQTHLDEHRENPADSSQPESASPNLLTANQSQNNLMKTSILILAAFLCSAALPARGADTFKIDPVHSSVLFSIKHLGVTDFYALFKDIAGTVTFDKADPAKSSVELTVPVESLDSRNPKRDQHLKSPDFFNAKQFPTLSFKSRKVEASGDTYKISGDFTLHGVTKPIVIEFKKGPEGKGMEGEVRGGGETRFTIKRSDYGMTFMKEALGDEVNIIVSLEGVKQ